LFGNRWLPQTTGEGCVGSSGVLLPPSPPAETTTTCQDQAGRASTGDGAGDGRGSSTTVECEARSVVGCRHDYPAKTASEGQRQKAAWAFTAKVRAIEKRGALPYRRASSRKKPGKHQPGQNALRITL